jgi:Pyruvate/2-oxoacid:ferredoxin oxidoreductase delta subunit
VHRVIPVNATVRQDVEVRPFESAAEIVARARAWGVTDCICRKQQALLGQACSHPLDVCMVLSEAPMAFDRRENIRALTQAEAFATLRRAAEAGLVHSVSNNQRGAWYICNCCTCACGILRGLAELGRANVIAASAFLCQVNEDKCIACGECVERCPFGALTIANTSQVSATRCAGCGVCVIGCSQEALELVRRPEADVFTPPETEEEWRMARAAVRGVDLAAVR